MTATQQINQEQEALNYLPAANEYYYDQYSRNDESRFILEKNSWKSIKQNNSSGKYLTNKEVEYVALINGFLKNARYGVEYFTLEFLCSELGITERHLRRIRKNTSHIFKTKWRKVTPSHKGLLKKVYVVRPTEHTVFLLGETNYYKSEYNSFLNNSVKSVKLGHQCPTSIYKDEKNINIRSNGANISNSNFNSQNTSTELVENSSGVAKGISCNSSPDTQPLEQSKTPQEPQAVETPSPTPATVTPIQTKARPANKRKTRTQVEQKQRKANNVVRNGFLGGGKSLSEIQPYLTDKICEKLRSGSGRAFTNKAIREITKAIAVSDKGSQAFFYHINGLISYLIPALIREKRDPNKVGGEGYYTLAGMNAEDKLSHEREKYLNKTENAGIQTRCDYTQLRAKIVGRFPTNMAYDLLTRMITVRKQDHIFELRLSEPVGLTEHYRQLLLSQANAVGGYSGVEELKVVVGKVGATTEQVETEYDAVKTKSTSQSTDTPNLVEREEPQLPKGKWGKVCSLFISQQEGGEALYQHWLAPLSVVEKEGIIELSTSSDMVKDRINQNYMPFLIKASKAFGIKELNLL